MDIQEEKGADAEEIRFLEAYREAPEAIQAGVRKLLDIQTHFPGQIIQFRSVT